MKSESVKVLVAQLCLTLCDSVDCSPPGSFVHVILQARMLEWVAVSFSRGSSQHRDQTQVSLFAGRFFTVWATKEAGENTLHSVISNFYAGSQLFWENVSKLGLQLGEVSQDCLVPERWQRGPSDSLKLVSGTASSIDLVMQMGDPSALLQKCRARAPS